MTLSEILGLGSPKLLALDEWQYQGEPTGLRMAALGDYHNQHRASVIVDPASQVVVALELFADDAAYSWLEDEVDIPLTGQPVTAQQALVILGQLLANGEDHSDPT